MTKGDEIRGLVREIENRVEAGILPDGNCMFDPLRVLSPGLLHHEV